jgi:hypothetical protein
MIGRKVRTVSEKGITLPLLKIERLTVLHEEIRDSARLQDMVSYVKSGGSWTGNAPQFALSRGGWTPIQVARLPDGMLLLHDGHHRAVATHLAGRDWLHQNEYELTDRPYDDFLLPNLENGWYTPLDPRTECRLAEYRLFREEVVALARRDPGIALAFIEQNRSRYACRRTISRVSELAQRAV